MSLNDQISKEILLVIEDKLSHLRKYGIENFGYRQFKKDGTSIGFCTYDYWEDIEDKKSFLESMSMHYKNELAALKDKASEFVVRAGKPDESSYFLKIIHKKNLWNSLVLYKKVDDMIEGYYFIASSYCNCCAPGILVQRCARREVH